MTKKEHNRRYKLHQKVKNEVDLKSKQRLIEVPLGFVTSNKYLIELRDRFHYNFQFIIK